MAPLELHELQIHAPEPPPPPPPPAPPPRRRIASSLPLAPDLPPDQPLEPGSGPPKFGARIAASEAALGNAAPQPPGTAGGKSSFIAAARRAAQTALQQGPAAPPPPRGEDQEEEIEAGESRSLPGKLMKRMKSLFVAAGIIGLVAGGAQIAGHKLHLGGGGNNDNTAKTGKIDTPAAGKLARKAPQVEIGLGGERMTTGSTVAPLAAPAVPSVPGTPAYNVGAAAPNSPPLLSPPDSRLAGRTQGRRHHRLDRAQRDAGGARPPARQSRRRRTAARHRRREAAQRGASQAIAPPNTRWPCASRKGAACRPT